MVISPGQALLLLIDHYKNSETKVEALKRLYLSGAENTRRADAIQTLFTDPALSGYQISYDEDVITNDPTRRYFETHLCYEVITRELSDVSKYDLEKHVHQLTALIEDEVLDYMAPALNGDIDTVMLLKLSLLHQEYGDYLSKIKSGALLGDLLQEDREKIELLVKSSFLATIAAIENPKVFPLNIYGKEIYSFKQRGVIPIQNQESTRNQNLGTMKSHMPNALNDTARAEKAFPYLKPTDRSTFDPSSVWVTKNFSKLVHPFTNSISGTALCQVRSLAKFDQEHQAVPTQSAAFTESPQKMANFLKLFISTMLFGTGGHSLYEFTALLSLPSVQSEFEHILNNNTLDIEALYYPEQDSIYYSGERLSFNTALRDTIRYNQLLLMKKALHTQIKGDLLDSESKIPVLNQLQAKIKTFKKLEDLSDSIKSHISSFYYTGLLYEIRESKQIKEKIEQGDFKLANNLLDATLKKLVNDEYPLLQSSKRKKVVDNLSLLKNQISELILLENNAFKDGDQKDTLKI